MLVKDNLNILVVEDSTTINSLIVESLRSLGYQAEGVFMGADALDLIAKNNYFTVLIDHVLPDMTGRDVINATLKVKGKVSFVVITGNGNERLAVELMKLGAVDYLVKDSNFIDLLPGVLDKVLKKYENEQLLISAQNKLEQQINDNQFLANLSLQLADPNGRHIVGDIALPLIKKHSGAIYAHFTAYNEDKKTFSIKHIETDNSLIRSIVSVGGEKILSKDYLVSDSLYHNLCENKFLQSNSLYKLTGGALPESVSKALKKVAGFKTLISIPQIHNGKLYGETTLAFSTAQDLPSAELLESFANILAVSLRNSLTETSLKQSEEMFRKLTENASDIIWTMDFNFNMQYVSPSVYNILGFAPKEYLKLTMEQKHPESTIDQFKLILQEELEKEHSDSEKNRALGMEIDHYNAKGEIVWLALQLSFIRDSDDKPIGIHGISRDITKRRRAEETLRESETILTKTQEIAHIGSWKLDLITNKLIWSNEVYQIFGCQPQEFSATYEAFLDFVHPDDRAAVDEAYSRSLREGTDNYEIEHRIVRQGTGEVRYVHERCIHIRDNADTVIQSIGMVQDITERKRTEERLRQSEKKLRQVIDLVPHFIFAKDVYGTYLLANKAIADAYGTTPENMLGKSDYDFAQNTQEVDFFIECDKKVIESGIGLYGIEEPMTDTEGSRRYFETSKIPFTTSDSKTPAVLAVSLDITERKQLELELTESAERFKALHNASFGGIAIHKKGIILECNQGLSDMTGYSLDELIGMSGLLLIAPEHREMVMDKIVTGFEKPYEANGLRKSGEQFPMRLEARNVPYKGESVRTVEFRDISESKQAENKLTESKLFLEKLLNTAPIPIFYKDIEGRYTGLNNSFEGFFGKSREELIGKSVSDINPPELASIYHAKDAELFNNIGTQIYESKVKTAAGEIRDVVFHKASLVDNAGCITGLVGGILDITDRKQAEQALKESEEFLNETGKTGKIGGWKIDLKTNQLHWTKQVYQIHEVDDDYIPTVETATDFYDDNSRSIIQHAVNDAIEFGKSFDVDLGIITAKGNHIFVRALGHAQKAEDGTIEYVMGAFQDITESKKVAVDLKIAKEKAERNEVELNKAHKIAHLGSWYLDIATNEVTWSEELYKMYNFDPTQPVPPYTKHMKLFTPESWEILSTSLAKTRETGIPYELELKTVKKDETNGWMWVRGEAVKDDNEKIIGLWGAAQDITERKKAEQALKYSEEHTQLLNKFLSELLELPDTKSIYAYLANSLQRYIGDSVVLCISVDEKKNETVLETIAGIDNSIIGKLSNLAGFNLLGRRYELKKNHLKYFSQGELVEFDGNLAEFSADQFPPKLAKIAEKLINLNCIYTHGIVRDSKILAAVHILTLNSKKISNPQFISSCIQQAALVLQKKIAEEKLFKSENSLRLINNEKDLFFQILAHDLKNPMGAIMGTSELLRESINDFRPEKRQLFIDQLYILSVNTFNLLEELLIWSNSQAGNLPFHPEQIQLKSHISEFIESIKPLATNKGISIGISIEKDIVVLADKNMLSVILRNLVVNAIKFTNNGGHIQIDSTIDNNKVIISVSDSGVGMNKETIDSIFKLDMKITTTGTNNELGTGFGLKLCKEFVEKNGGKIWAESEVGKGSVFKFLLTLENENA